MSPESVLGPPEILRHARREASRLAMVESWTPAFAGSSPGLPLLVKRLDQTGRYYYLVPFGVGEHVTVRLRMDAHTGNYAEGISVGRRGDALQPFRTPEQAHRRVALKLEARAKHKKKIAQALPVITIEPFLVWKPCAQSFSAFLPFYLITVSGSEFYVRVDGRVFDTLTFGAGL